MFPRTLVIVLFLAAQTALLWTFVARDRTSPSHFTWTTVTVPTPAPPPPALAPVPQPAPPQATRPSCPPPRVDAVAPGKLDAPRGVNHVTTSLTNAGWLAAWSEHQVFVSTDAGKNFARVLDGPGDVTDVTFDCFGHPIVSREGRIGILDNGRELWRSIPGFATGESERAMLIGGGHCRECQC